MDLSILYRFQNDNHFVAYAGELHPSPTVTARCIHALMVMGRDVAPFQRFLLDRQDADGRWTVDKWNRSWLYATGHAAIALIGSPHGEALREAVEAVLVCRIAKELYRVDRIDSIFELSAMLMLDQRKSKERGA